MGRWNLAVRAMVMMAAVTAAAAAATIQPQASAAKPSAGIQASPLSAGGRPSLTAGVPCRVITVNPLGVCPPAVTPVTAGASEPRVMMCPKLARERMEPRPALCGSGFHPGDHIDVIVIGGYGSTFWPVESDPYGRFKSTLPSPLCRLTPATVFALDMHRGGSRSIRLGGARCP